MSGITSCNINNINYPVRGSDDQGFQFDDVLEVPGALQVIVQDASGTANFERGDPIELIDSVEGVIYSGTILSSKPLKASPDPANTYTEHTVQCIDRTYPLTKLPNTTNYENWYAGDVAVDMVVNGPLGDEGITVAAGLHRDSTQTDFNRGILSNTIGTLTVGDGCLELAPSGSDVTYTEASLPLTPPSTNVLKIVAVQSAPGLTSSATYVKIWSGSTTITSSTELSYDVFIDPSSPQKTIAIDLTFSDGTTMRGNYTTADTYDFYNIAPQPTTDLTGFADVGWYHRAFTLPSFAGKTLQYVAIAVSGTEPGTYTGYVRNVALTNPSVTIFNGTLNVDPPQQIQSNGYSSTELSVVSSYDIYSPTTPSYGPKFYTTTSSISVGAVNILRSSFISWTAIEPDKTHIAVKYSLDGGNAYTACVNNAPLPNLPSGLILTGKSILLQYQFYGEAGANVELAPTLESLTVQLYTSYATTKADVTYEATTQANWLAGTLTNTRAPGAFELLLNGGIAKTAFSAGGTLPVYTTIASGVGPSFGSVRGVGQAFNIPQGNELHVRLDQDNMPQLANFIAEVDVNIDQPGLQYCLLYRTTNWSNADKTWGYMAGVGATSIQLGYGSNSSSASFTNISTITLALNTSGDTWHRLKVVVNGSSHNVYLDDVLYISATDSTYTSSGYLGLRAYNVSNANTNPYPNMQFNNVGVVSALSGTWVSPSTSLTPAGSYGNSVISWRDKSASYNGLTNYSILVEASTDGGSTYATCTNGAPLPGLTVGTSLSGKNLKIRVTLATATAGSLAAIDNLIVYVLGQYSASGVRSTKPMGIDYVDRADQSGFGTASDGQGWTPTGTGTPAVASNKLTITNTTGDFFEQLGSRTDDDMDMTVPFSLSASTMTGGMTLRYVDSNNYYKLQASTTSIDIVKKVAGVSYTLQSVSSTLAINTQYYMRFRVVNQMPVDLYGRIWLAGTLEDQENWTISTSD